MTDIQDTPEGGTPRSRHTVVVPNSIDMVSLLGPGDEHLALLSNVATLFSDEEQIAKLKAASTPQELYALLQTVNEG